MERWEGKKKVKFWPFIGYMTNFEPTLLVKCVIDVKNSTFSPFQDIYSYNYIEFLLKYREMHDIGQKFKNLSLWKSINFTQN